MEWQPIETVPKDGSIVELRDAKNLYHCAMYWNEENNRWEGMSFGMLGTSKTYWDESSIPIAEWKELTR